jgi:hypothetical protein
MPQTAARAGDDVRDDFFIRVPQMRLAVDVVNGGRNVEWLAHCGRQYYFKNPPMPARKRKKPLDSAPMKY